MSKKSRLVAATPQLTHNPFAKLGPTPGAAQAPAAALGPTPPDPNAEVNRNAGTTTAAATDLRRLAGKVVIRRERKGHGGKTVTLVEGLDVEPSALEQLCREMRTNLGCGGHVAGPMLVLAGDQSARVQAWLRQHGVKQLVLGN